MPQEYELESMVVRLKGDGSGYNSMLQQAQASAKTASASIGASMASIPASLANSTKRETSNFLSMLPSMVAGALETVGSAVGITIQAGLSVAGSAVSALAGSVGTALSSLASSIGSILGAAINGVISLAKSLPIAFMAAGAVLSITANSMLSSDAAARKLGLSIGDLNAAWLWSGQNQQTVQAALGTTQRKLAELGRGAVDASADFRSLSAATGKTVDELSGSGWSGVVDAIAAIEDPTLRAAQAFRFLGDSAGDFLGQLDRGPGAAKAMKDATSMGLGASSGDLQAARQVAETLRQAEALMKGAFNQVVLALGPLFAELSRSFDLTKVNLTWIRPMVYDIAKGAAMVGAFFVEAFSGNKEVLAAFFSTLQKGIEALGNVLASTLIAAFGQLSIYLDKQLTDPTTSLGRFFGGIKYATGGGNAALEEQKKAEQASQRRLNAQTVLGPQQTMTKMMESAFGSGLSEDAYKKYMDRARPFLMQQMEELGKSALGGLQPDARHKMMADLMEVGVKTDKKSRERDAAILSDQLDIYKGTVPEVYKKMAKEAAPGGGVVDAFAGVYDAMKKSTAFQDVENFFGNATKNVEDFDKKLREAIPANQLNELAKQFVSLRNSASGALTNWNEALSKLKAFTAPEFSKLVPQEDLSLIAGKMFADFSSAAGVPRTPSLAGAAEYNTKEAYSAAAQYGMLAERNDIQQQMRAALELANEQRKALIAIGEQTLRWFRSQNAKTLKMPRTLP